MKMSFSNHLLQWYNIHKRALPWRASKDPYRVWLSEIILQQTRVAQGTPYYYSILEKFPNVETLAAANVEEVLSLWQGLGYYSRGRNLHTCAQQVVHDHDGKFPTSSTELLKLKGIGKYTAAAISSICFNEVIPVIDGNVYRVLSRYLNLDQDISENQAYRVFHEAAIELIDEQKPGDFNQAMMEFGALQCTPKNPDCHGCVLQDSCEAFRLKIVDQRPVKTKKVKVRHRFFHYIVIRTPEGFLMNERKSGDIWQGLNDFYLIEKEDEELKHEEPIITDLNETKALKVNVSNGVKHVLTHQVILARFHLYDISSEVKDHFIRKYNLKCYSFASISQVPKPVLIHNYLKIGVNSLNFI